MDKSIVNKAVKEACEEHLNVQFDIRQETGATSIQTIGRVTLLWGNTPIGVPSEAVIFETPIQA